YYISCGADKIFAQPTTLTGSIGIYGLVPNINNLIQDKIGLTPNTFASNPNGVMSIFEPLSPVQKIAFQKAIDRGYETFVGRCAVGRKLDVDSIKAVAQGRVWTGADAMRIGLVDQLGSLSDCIEDLALTSGFDSYEIEVYPDKNMEWWEEILSEAGNAKTALVRNELGMAYPYYKAVKDLERMNRIQALAPQIEIR
ncbi:MAG: S49 family peptidase, partial [Muribaculum sp.]|nr:S49 family peptidase [Muribaculum sp.]